MRMSDLVTKATGHAEELKSVESWQGLFVEHRRFSSCSFWLWLKLGVAYPFAPCEIVR